MPVFSDTDQLHGVMCDLWEQLKAHPETGAKLRGKQLVVRFIYRDPDGIITIDGRSGDELHIYAGESDIKADVEFIMTSDVAHKFWLGKEPIAMSLMQGKIRSRGPVNKALALLPAIRPAFEMYPAIIQARLETAA